jgi:hypothetical protein
VEKHRTKGGQGVNATWAATIPRESLSFAGRLRLAQIEVCAEKAGEVWLRGAGGVLSLKERRAGYEEILFSLPGIRLFDVANNLITPAGRTVPTGRLPQGPWLPLSEALGVAAPTSALAGKLSGKIQLKLVRTEQQREANVLVADPRAWREWGIDAPAVRLSVLKFALSVNRVAVWGEPLPSIAGERFSESGGIAVPCGWELHPVSDAEIVRPLLKAAPGDLAIFFENGTYDLIDSSLFVAATRSAVRGPGVSPGPK